MKPKWVLLLGTVLVLTVAAHTVARVRMPVAAGLFYPAEVDKLVKATQEYMAEAKVPELPGRYVACVVPHSAYPFCGKVAAHAFKPLKQGQYDRVIVLASSHFATFRGCSIPAVEFYRTPLGDIPIDVVAREKLQWNTLIDIRSVLRNPAKQFDGGGKRVPLHEVEYSVEVILPFLQEKLGTFSLVPIIVSDFLDYNQKPDNAALDSVAKTLKEIIDDRTLIVASTDFTHFGNTYGYRPFNDNFSAQIEELDVDAFELVLHRDELGFEKYLTDTGNAICGASVLELLMRLLPPGTQGVLLDYTKSGDITGSFETSVSYASIAFYNPQLPATEPRKRTQRVLPAPEPITPPANAAEKKTATGENKAEPVVKEEIEPVTEGREKAEKPESKKKGISRFFQKRDKAEN